MNTESSEKSSDKRSGIDVDEHNLGPQSFNPFRNRRHTTTLLLVVTLAALIAAGYVAYQFYLTGRQESNIIRVNGRIEAHETHISAPTATRVKSVTVKEGEFVHKGQLIVMLDSENLQKRISASGPALKAALTARRETDLQVAAVQQQIGEARARSKGFIAKLFSTRKGRAEKATQLRGDLLQAKMMSSQARSAVATVEGARAQASSKLSYFNITSPIDGICATRSSEPGELVAAGQVMLTLVDLSSAYLRGFLPESDVARIKIGQSAEVFLDSRSAKPFSGRVTSIDAHPSFTPANVYFKNDRLRQAFGITISIDHPNGLAKPGMPAEANVLFNSREKMN